MNMATNRPWSPQQSASLYEIDRWSDGYFNISDEGTITVSPTRKAEDGVDLKQLVDRLKQRGLDLPILIRFNGILGDRLKTLSHCFQKAIDDHDYKNGYRCIYPIKV
ncbi:MAG: arginine decarboxylase, partial [Planctomycetaceae bacterium]|nr:arginine decarboxylase [Planctomycetaceae bacterium]